MVFEAHGMSFPCTEHLLFNYAKVNSFPFYGTFKYMYFVKLLIIKNVSDSTNCIDVEHIQ